MSQIAIKQGGVDLYDLALNESDGEHLVMDESLRTCVLISVLTDRRATEEQAPDPSDLGGWWGDTYTDVPGDETGSLLWTLKAAKAIPETLQLAEQHVRDALQWMIDDGIVSALEVEVEAISATVLGYRVGIVRPKKPAPEWVAIWQQSL